ncbi:hypothetical protein [Salinarchaeum laminariae]|nr:hypothetical protein [Salinarchaeum laminariae]
MLLGEQVEASDRNAAPNLMYDAVNRGCNDMENGRAKRTQEELFDTLLG